MPRGPLPDPNSRRRNAPTIPSTSLPASGRKGRAPAVPEPIQLKKAGRAWWNAAWKTPQAASWDAGAIFTVARRATLEDDLAILDHFEPFDIEGFLGIEPNEAARELGFIIGRLKSLAGGRISVMKEMRELERQLGLGPKALADLRWVIVDDADDQAGGQKPAKKKGKAAKKGQPKPGDRRTRLTVVGGTAAAAE